MKKGDVLGTAQIAGIMAAKKTSAIVPMCHPLMLTGIDIDFSLDGGNSSPVEIRATKSDAKASPASRWRR